MVGFCFLGASTSSLIDVRAQGSSDPVSKVCFYF